jgi:hypothetical protein
MTTPSFFRIGTFILLGCLAVTGCSSTKSPLATSPLPLVTPPVAAATPAGLGGQKSALNQLKSTLRGLVAERVAHADPPPGAESPAGQFKDRFFSGMGPTDVLGTLLPTVDRLIANINSTSANSPCLTQEPVAYTIQPFGQMVSMYGQCYRAGDGGGANSFLQFGVKDGTTYLYLGNSLEEIAAIVTPIDNGKYKVLAFLTLGSTQDSSSTCGAVQGYGGDWDTCSYGVMALSADESTQQIELAVAGIGFGFCGAQLASDGTNIYATGSGDMGDTCNAVDTVCLSAADATTPANCTPAETTFALTPLGRGYSMRSAAAAHSQANTGQVITTWGASQYPLTPDIVLDGTATDSVHAGLGGPTSPTAGLGSL